MSETGIGDRMTEIGDRRSEIGGRNDMVVTSMNDSRVPDLSASMLRHSFPLRCPEKVTVCEGLSNPGQ
jgi:hypothetical protein